MIDRVRVVLLVIATCGAAVLFAAAFPDAILAGDADPFRQRMAELFAGRLPYFGFPFEHLPGMVVPMAAAWLLGGFQDLRSYVFALAAVSALCLLATALVLRRVQRNLNSDDLSVRWLTLVTPLLPFVLFRNDSWAILLTVLALAAFVDERRVAGTAAAVFGVLSKLWTVVLAPVEWWRGRRGVAAIIAVSFVVGLAIQLAPPVQSIQNPQGLQGLHTETLMGSVVGLTRSLASVDLDLSSTAAVYIDAPRWFLLINLGVGVGLALFALAALRKPFNWLGAWRMIGALTIAGVLASPFFSTQYVSWVAPFVAIGPGFVSMLIVNVASLVLITTWQELFDGTVWWWGLLVVRNVMFVSVGLGLAKAAGRPLSNSWEKSGTSAIVA